VDWIVLDLDVVISCLTGPSTCTSMRTRKKIREEDSCLMTAGLGRGRPDNLDDTVFTGRCKALTILSDN